MIFVHSAATASTTWFERRNESHLDQAIDLNQRDADSSSQPDEPDTLLCNPCAQTRLGEAQDCCSRPDVY